MTSTRIRLCGALAVELEGRRVEDALPGGKALLLFRLPRFQPRACGQRDELIAALWNDHPPVSPEASLRTLLARLRPVIGKQVIRGRQQLRLALPADAVIDAELGAAA